MEKIHNETLEKGLELFGGNASIRLGYNDVDKYGVAEVIAPYIPMADFMEAFDMSLDMIEKYNLKNFIFDKRSMNVFHQPSMEWYFVQWKPKARKLGVFQHYKIMPEEDWFLKCVEAGRETIAQNYPDDLLEGITITYTKSVAEAVSLIRGI